MGVAHLKNGDGSKMKRGLLDSSRCRKERSDGGDGREKMGPRKSCGSKFGLEEDAPLWLWGSHWEEFAKNIYDWLWTAQPSSLNQCPHTLPGFITHHKYFYFSFQMFSKIYYYLYFKNNYTFIESFNVFIFKLYILFSLDKLFCLN